MTSISKNCIKMHFFFHLQVPWFH